MPHMWPFWGSRGNDSVCDSTEFKSLWSGFIDAVVDSALVRGPAAPPPRPADEDAPRHTAVLPAAERLVAIGDVHGDLDQMKRILMASNLVDDNLHWVGGKTVLVQVGDQLDRGEQESSVLYVLERLQREAARAGGGVHVLNGNHETMNIGGDLRFATVGGAADFARLLRVQRIAAGLKRCCSCSEGWSEFGPATGGARHSSLEAAAGLYEAERAACLRPGSAFTRRFFASHPMVLQVGGTVFVHGGLLPEHLAVGVPAINAQAQDWMEGKLAREPEFLQGRDAVVWSRKYSHPQEARCDCGLLEQTLAQMSARRMVVGHTIQGGGVNGACSNSVLRVDVGMSRGCGFHEPQALEIIADSALYRIGADGSRIAVAPTEGSTQNMVWDILHGRQPVATKA